MLDYKLLIAREQRAFLIGKMSQKFDTVTIKANVPGEKKNIPLAKLVTKHFARVVRKIGVSALKEHYSADGLTVFGKVNNGLEFKEFAVSTEEVHPLGRLIDIDVILKGEKQSLSRGRLRKCFLCDKPAFVCGKIKTHTVGELLDYFNNTAYKYFHNFITKTVKESMMFELNIENKFGLVTPNSNGSHKDMSYSAMVDAVNVISERLADAFFVGLNADKCENLAKKLIPIGLDCEKRMLEVTKGANAYKGFIFAGGLLLASSGFALANALSFSKVYCVCASVYAGFPMPTNTFGFESYQKGFGGIRKEAKTGFSTVKKAQTLINKKAPWQVLTFILSKIDDSVLLKRTKTIEKYDYFKKIIVNANNENRKAVTEECIKNNVSIGGSADILICAHLMNTLKQNFIF